MKRAFLLAGLAALGLAPAARGQTPYDELTGILEVTGDEAAIEGVRLIYVPPQTGVNLDPLLQQTADNVRPMDGQKVHATGELREGILWSARVEPADMEQEVLVDPMGPGAEFDELTGILEVTRSEASIEGVRLIYVPPQTRVAVDPLLAQTADNVRMMNGLRVRATGQLRGDILWGSVVEKAEEEEIEAEEIEETVVEEAMEEEPAEDEAVQQAVQEVPPEE